MLKETPDADKKAGGGSPLLEVNNIEVIYNHVILVLKGVSLTVPQGGIVSILGANGAIPVLAAAWGPPVSAMLLGVGLLLHMEDG